MTQRNRKVWVIIWEESDYDYHASGLAGIFTSRKAALNAARAYAKKHSNPFPLKRAQRPPFSYPKDVRIERFTLNKPMLDPMEDYAEVTIFVNHEGQAWTEEWVKDEKTGYENVVHKEVSG